MATHVVYSDLDQTLNQTYDNINVNQDFLLHVLVTLQKLYYRMKRDYRLLIMSYSIKLEHAQEE